MRNLRLLRSFLLFLHWLGCRRLLDSLWLLISCFLDQLLLHVNCESSFKILPLIERILLLCIIALVMIIETDLGVGILWLLISTAIVRQKLSINSVLGELLSLLQVLILKRIAVHCCTECIIFLKNG